MDPNWFYSTVAQASAAIVGVSGGFLIARLISRRDEVVVHRQPAVAAFDALMNELEGDRDRAIRAAIWMKYAIRDLANAPEGAPFTTSTVELLNRSASYSKPISVEGVTVPAVEQARQAALDFWDALDALSREELARRLVTRQSFPTPAKTWLGEPPPQTFGGAPDLVAELGEQAATAQMAWIGLNAKFNDVRRELDLFRQRIVPKRMFVLILLLAGLLIVGTIIPVTSLSAHRGSSKTLIIIGFTVFSLGFLAFMAWELMSLRSAANLARPWF